MGPCRARGVLGLALMLAAGRLAALFARGALHMGLEKACQREHEPLPLEAHALWKLIDRELSLFLDLAQFPQHHAEIKRHCFPRLPRCTTASQVSKNDFENMSSEG